MQMIINGNLVDSDKKIDVINPVNSHVIDTVPSGTINDVKTAIESAVEAQKVLANYSSRKVSRIMYDIYEDLKQNSKELANILTRETGKPINDANDEIKRSVETVLLAAEESKRIYGETVPLDAGIGGRTALGFTVKVPLGVVTAITPFNYPVNLAVHKIAPAIAAKNSVILKPSTQAPLAALKMVQIFDAHLPAGAVNAITGKSSVIGDELVINPHVNKISFTGSVETGVSISKKAGMKRINLELGGNDPLIVLADADIDKAVEAAIKGSFLFSGQVCIAVKRIILEESIADEFATKMVQRTRKLKVGDPLDPETDMGPMIDEKSAIMVENLVVDAQNRGAKLLVGGEREGAFYLPTILDHVETSMDMVCNETFGPVAPLLRVKNLDEAINIANDTQYGLQAGIFTKSIENALQAAREIEAGSVIINRQSTFRTDNMPFGGFKMSGTGKEGIKYAVEDMTRSKLIIFG
ncbi:MAG: aldehyde dehydrogenase family protein [Methanobacterium sp.]|nr:aldehyde dehydrogenase family protein [Methanobacterium sp.]